MTSLDEPRPPRDWRAIRTRGWASPLARFVSGQNLFLTISGLSILLLPTSVFNQHGVIVHTLLGLLFLPVCLVYMWKHIKDYWDYPLTHTKFTGWVSGVFTVVCLASGVILTWDGVFGTQRSEVWRLTHIVTTVGMVLFLSPHLVAVVIAERKRREQPESAQLLAYASGHGKRAMAGALFGLALTGVLCVVVPPVDYDNRFPDDYVAGPDGPFAPSLARTDTGGAFDKYSLAGSHSCGTSGCHTEILEEWQPSAHRYAAMDVGFQAIQGVMAEQNGPESTRYCGGCHDPISLFAGEKRIGGEELTAEPGHHEGISCLSCHAIEETDVKGNANYVMSQPPRYVFEQREGAVAKMLSDFLIRTYPDQHVAALSRRMFKTPEFCAACHKQFIDESVNRVGWVQLQNQYDNWKASRWHDEDDQTKTIECRECHMPLQASSDPAAGDAVDWNRSADDGMHRSHRFLGANQYVPLLHDLPGAEEHVALTEQWLRGEYEIPEIADRWSTGPAVTVAVDAPREVVPGDNVALRVHLANNKVGHDFPTGPLDIIQAWVEITVTDDQGTVVYDSGTRDENAFVEPGTFMFKAEPVDRYGNLIDRHNLWEMVGVRFKRSMFPGASEVARYEFPCPGTASSEVEDLPRVEARALAVPEGVTGELTVTAVLNYRKFDQFLLNFAFGEDSGLTSTVTELSRDQTTIRVVSAADSPTGPPEALDGLGDGKPGGRGGR
jgi:hypothetical protein